MWESTPKW